MQRIVIKVGSAVVTQDNELAVTRLRALIEFIATLRKTYEVILVSSGAVAAGYTQLMLDKTNIANKQALAAIGQPKLMSVYKSLCADFDITAAQVLITKANFESTVQVTRAKQAVDVLLKHKVLPIVNENDATAVDELVVGDNDQLSAYVAHYFDASMLIILSDIDAFYDKDPHIYSDAKALTQVQRIDEAMLAQTPVAHGEFATGGIVTKLKAAHFLMQHNRAMFLASGFDLRDAHAFLLDNHAARGTLFKR